MNERRTLTTCGVKHLLEYETIIRIREDFGFEGGSLKSCCAMGCCLFRDVIWMFLFVGWMCFCDLF